LRGVSAWWPSHWEMHWAPLHLWFSPTSRVDAAAAITGVGIWWIATAGSDQMAIQRYLSTRDLKSARRMFGLSMAVNTLIACVLGLLGFALLAFFQHHPEMLAANQDLTKNADQLLPRYIVVGLPAGLSGLLIAALVAATMSSLSSGINSASSVITSDLVGRLRRTAFTQEDRLRTAKRVSWIVGLLAVALSLLAGGVEGNLFEKCYKIANVFTVPLFMLFFMAIFVPWATTLGTWAATIASAVVAIGIGIFGWFHLGFLWIVIGSMIAGVVVGPLVSLLDRLLRFLVRLLRRGPNDRPD